MSKETTVRVLEPYFVKRDENDFFWRYSNPANLVPNGDFELWLAGTAVAPDNWTLTGAAATVARSATSQICSFAAQVTRVGTDCYLERELTCFDHLQGLYVSLGCWVRATVASRVRLGIDDGVGQSFSDYHVGDSTFIFLTVTRLIDSAATKVEVRLQVDTGNTAGIFDGAILVVGPVPRAYADKPPASGDTVITGTVIKDVPSGDPRNIYRIAGVAVAVTGVDDDDSDSFKIAIGTDVLGTAADVMTIETSGEVGFGLTSPTEKVHISYSDVAAAFAGLRITNTGANAANSFAGINVTTQANTVQIGVVAVPTGAALLSGGGLLLRTITNHSLALTTNNVTAIPRVMITAAGRVGVGVVAPLAQHHVDQASTTAAIPVAYLDQADLSEEFIEFATTIGVGNPIEAIGAKTLTTTHFIRVTLPGGLARYIPCGTIA